MITAGADDGATIHMSQNIPDRIIPAGSQTVISPWYMHRHTKLWENPDRFDPAACTVTLAKPVSATLISYFQRAHRSALVRDLKS